MDRVQSRILEIAQQIPEYVGYQAKERRREEDKLVRRQLAVKYEESRTRLSRIARQAPLDKIVAIENLDQKLQRLIARLNTAPPGYAGWFDAGQIVESDLEQLTDYDSSLADGVDKLNAVFQQLGNAVKSRSDVSDAVDNCADLIDQLNYQFDQREQFLAMGIKATLPAATRPTQSALGALKETVKASPELLALTNLKKGDAVAIGSSDLLVSARITYSNANGVFWAYLLQDPKGERWLRVGPGNMVSLCSVVSMPVPTPLPDRLEYQGKTFTLEANGTATASVEGPTATLRGDVGYSRYTSANVDEQIWIEDFSGEVRTSAGSVLDPIELKVYRK